MATSDALEELRRAAREVPVETQPDLLEVRLEGETAETRWESCLRQLGNPYEFRVGSAPVRVTFAGEMPLGDRLTAYFTARKAEGAQYGTTDRD